MDKVGENQHQEAGMHVDASFDLRRLTAQEFAALGLEQVAFIKPKRQGKDKMFAIHTADGREVAVVVDRDIALFTVREHDMEPLSVH